MSTYDVRLWSTRESKGKDPKTGKPVTRYRVRWAVAGNENGQTFQTKALAESFRAKLVTAQREGTAFDEFSGLPEPMARELNSRSWYEHAVNFVDMKWPRSAAKHRKSIAEALMNATMHLLTEGRGAPPDDQLRAALRTYAFNKARRTAGPPPAELAGALSWVERHTVRLRELADAALIRKVLDGLATKLDGTAAAATTVARKRAVFSGALRYAVELGQLDTHPMDQVSWVAPKTDDAVDRLVVANPRQARALLAAVEQHSPELVAFFGCMYYAAMRPEEVLHLREDEYRRPKRRGGWGELRLTGATVAVGEGWSDSNGPAEDRGLKHRSRTTVRPVPAAPALCELLDQHIGRWPSGEDGRLFVSRRGPGGMYRQARGKPIPSNSYTAAWRRARAAALTPAQQRSPLARRPYDLRHAAVSLWLNAGVPAPQVAEWAGHSVHVLMKVYAKCIDGGEAAARRRIEAALAIVNEDDEESSEPPEQAT
jgi:integrase